MGYIIALIILLYSLFFISVLKGWDEKYWNYRKKKKINEKK